MASDFILDGETVISVPKESFLVNADNKSRFISLLSSHFVQNGFDSIHASADADCQIVHTTLETTEQHNVVLIGEDTDLFFFCTISLQIAILCSSHQQGHPQPKCGTYRL